MRGRSAGHARRRLVISLFAVCPVQPFVGTAYSTLGGAGHAELGTRTMISPLSRTNPLAASSAKVFAPRGGGPVAHYPAFRITEDVLLWQSSAGKL